MSNTLGNNIRHLRKTHKFTLKQLAKKLDISVSTLDKYQQGDIIPPLDKLIVMRELFGNSLDDLVFEDLTK